MNEEPTIPIGLNQGNATDRAEPLRAPVATSAWGSFTLLARVGYGGFGEVYRAWDPHLQREVALKLLLPGAIGGEAEYEAMLREARALASVRHSNIVPVHGIDRHDGRVGFWTDFVRGKTLSVLVGEQGTFGAREAALIGLDVTRALSAVHRAGLLHRDIKAENVMREEGGRILLMDFGLSALEQRQTSTAGTPNYMAPELFNGGQSTVASDIYAMGVLLYFLVAGDFPAHLRDLTTQEVLAALSRRKPLMDLRPDLSESLLRTISTAMEMEPARRFTSAGQLASALAESLGTQVPADVTAAANQVPIRKRKQAWVVAAFFAALVLSVGILFWTGSMQKLLHRTNGSSTALTGTTENQFEKAQSLLLHSYKEANLVEAVKGFEAVLKAEPDSALAEARLGLAHFIQYKNSDDPKLLELAKEETNRAIQLESDLADPYITLSRIAAAQGQTQLATQQANKALNLDRRSAEAYGALGEVYEAEGRGKDALDAYQKASDLAPDDWRWPMSLGVFQYEQGNIQEAVSQLQRGVDLAPDNAYAFLNLSIAHLESGHVDEARKDLEQSLAIEPTGKTYSALSNVLRIEGKYDDAASMEKKAIALSPDRYQEWADLGLAYRWSGTRHEEAAEAFRKAVELEEAERAKKPQDADLLANLAQNYAFLGNSAKSLPLLRQALALAANDRSVQYAAGETYEVLGQRDKAIALLAPPLASGYRTAAFERNPGLAALRADPNFQAALKSAKEEMTRLHP